MDDGRRHPQLSKHPPAEDSPLRHGYGDTHNLYPARLSLFDNYIDTTVFWDYGCTSCYISQSLASHLKPYKSRRQTTMSGIGGQGPRILFDCVFFLSFQTKSGTWTEPLSLTAGVVPDHTFPGHITLGKSKFHELGVVCDIDAASRHTLSLTKLLDKPVLTPLVTDTAHVAADSVYVASETHYTSPPGIIETPYVCDSKDVPANPQPEDTGPIQWHKNTPKSQWVRDYLAQYERDFPEVLDITKRRPTKKMKTQHYIETGDAAPVKLPPRRYSPSQEAALRKFVQAHDGVHVQRSKSPWGAPALLTPKKPPGESNMPKVRRTCSPRPVSPTRSLNRVQAARVLDNQAHRRLLEKIIWRICCDYRELNKRTKKHAHPLPNAFCHTDTY
ncbi:hypothetical protein GGR50DRAFT_697701 [Xylaria sp. CBS 124048]|nr:hypothetical protein GGR50DRAFT_697701 [Xylaria sp. CBS 124048]